MKRIVPLVIAFLLLACPALQAGKRPKIAYLEVQDRHTKVAGLAEQLKRIGHKGTSIVAKIREEGFKPSSCDVLLVGSFALGDKDVRDWFRRSVALLRKFVADGGAVLVFTQETDVWDIEPWLPEVAFVLRGRSRFDKLGYINGEHPVFQTPNPVTLDRLNTEWVGDGKWPGHTISWWPFRTVRRGAVWGAQTQSGRDPWFVEMGWGTGRVLLFACTPDKVAPDQPALTRDCCDAFLQNILAYAGSVADGNPHPLPEGVPISADDVDRRIYLKSFTREEEQDFDARVNAAVDKGIVWLKKQQKEDGSWGPYDSHSDRYEAGLTALSLMALLNSGVNKYDSCIQKGFGFMMANPPKHTYEIGYTLMAFEKRAAPMYERFKLARMSPEEREDYQFVRELSPEELTYMEELTELLVSHHKRGGCWGYNLNHGEDISNGQFAVLGLKAASRCGIRVPQGLWEEIIKYYVTYQSPSGPKVKCLEFKEFAPDGTPKFYVTQAKARGWNYGFGHPDPKTVAGSRVNIGISCLILVYEELMKIRSPEGPRNRAKVREAIRDGLAWLDNWWCIDALPNGEKHYYYYYIYSLERVGALTGRRFIGQHDWYHEGAAYLIEKQENDGLWGTQANEWGSNISNTSFALLFLKRSTPPPVITVK